MAKDCCWNCKWYIARGDNEPAVLAGADANVCVYTDKDGDQRSLSERACPTSPAYVCSRYSERFY